MKLSTFFDKFDQFADAPDAVAKMRELVLRMATSGRIADQDPADQPGSELLEEIFAVRDNLIKRGAAKSRVEGNPITAGDTIDLPRSWARCMISEVCDLQTGATPSRAEHSYFGGETPWLVSGDINKGEITDCDGRITKEGLENSNCKIIPANSVLIALNGQGKTRATVAVLRIPAALNQSLVAMIPYSGERLLPEYIFWNLRGRYYAIRDITGQDQRRGLNMKLVGQLSIPVPPLAEQKRIVAKVDELMALCDRLEAQQQERETRHTALARASLSRFADAPTPANLNLIFHSSYSIPPADLRKSILTLAVQGKLVPQDPNDEPAEGLLERVASALPDKKSENPFLGEIEASITDESEYKLPLGWAWLPLGHVGIWATGCGFPMQYQGETEGEFLFCKVSDMNLPGNEVEIHTTVHKIDADVMKKIRARANPVGTVIFPKIGGAIATHKRRLVIKPTIIDNNCSGIQPIGLTDDSWLLLFLRNLDLTKYQSGTSVPAVSQGSLDPIRIGLPPLAEQRRIVAKVDQLMALVDALETQLAASRATAANLLSALVAELTGTPNTGKVSPRSASATGRRGRPRKSS